MKYEREFNELASLFYEDWMDAEDKEEFKQTLLEVFGSEHFDNLMQWGVDEGVGPQVQVEMLRAILEKEMENEGQN
ncbi:MAG: hypothetical protein ACOCP4_07595 [Candidatus Woesearchaeota archaeon]